MLRRLGLPDTEACRALVVQLDQSVARTDRRGRILGFRLGAQDFLADVPASVLSNFEADPGAYLTDMLEPDARRHLLETIDASLRHGEPVPIEISTRLAGRPIQLAATCAPCGGDEVLWVVRDLTTQHEERRVAAERNLLESTINDCLHSLIDIDGEQLDLALESVMHRIAEFFGANRAYLRRFRDASHVEVICQWRTSRARRAVSGTSIAGKGAYPWAARHLSCNRVLVVPDTGALGPEAATDLGHLDLTRDRGFVWIRTGPPRRPTGIFGLVFDEPVPRRAPETYEPLIALADTMLSLVERNVDTARRELQHRVFELIARGAPLGDVLDEVCRLGVTGAPGQICVVWLAGDDGTLRPAGSTLPAATMSAFDPLPADALEARAAGDGSSRWLRRDDPDAPPLGPLADHLAATAVAVTVLHSSNRDRITGVLAVYDTSDDPVNPDSRGGASPATAASLATIAIERTADLVELSHRATHDALTGLANRATFLDRLAASLERAAATGRLAAVLYCDIDRFKEMNDRLGHAAGDTLLRILGARVVAQIPATALTARLGGDEFAVLLEDLTDEETALEVAERVRVAVQGAASEHDRPVTVSIGVAVSGSAADHADGLLRDADVAMYLAKSGGRNRVEVFRERIRREVRARDRLGRDLAESLADGRIEVHFQPMIALETGRLTGFEALARWKHAEHGYIPPDVFVPIAESAGLIGPLGDLVLEQALAAASAWPQLDLHVNLSAHQIDKLGYVDGLLERVEASQVSPERLAMEVTESVLLSESAATVENLRALLASGIGLVLDDFGTGYASLTYLRRFPFRGIKVDKSFVSGLDHTSEDSVIVSMVLALAASLGLDVVAEGVETAEQELALRRMGCTRVQGFRYSEPVPAARVPALIERYVAAEARPR